MAGITVPVLAGGALLPVAGAALAVGLGAAIGDDESEVELSVRPAEQAVAAGETATFDIVVEGADAGVSAYELAVHLSDGETAAITDLGLTGEPAVPLARTDDDTTAAISAAMGPEPEHVPADEIVVATVMVTGRTAGEFAELSISEGSEVAPISQGGAQYAVGDRGTATVTVVEDSG